MESSYNSWFLFFTMTEVPEDGLFFMWKCFRGEFKTECNNLHKTKTFQNILFQRIVDCINFLEKHSALTLETMVASYCLGVTIKEGKISWSPEGKTHLWFHFFAIDPHMSTCIILMIICYIPKSLFDESYLKKGLLVSC